MTGNSSATSLSGPTLLPNREEMSARDNHRKGFRNPLPNHLQCLVAIVECSVAQ